MSGDFDLRCALLLVAGGRRSEEREVSSARRSRPNAQQLASVRQHYLMTGRQPTATMTSKSRLPPPPAPNLPPTNATYPFNSATGSALDVIVVAPSSYQLTKSSRRRSSSQTQNPVRLDVDSDGGQVHPDLPPAAATTRKGIVASSDFFVTFPPALAWVENNANDFTTSIPNNSSSIVEKSLTKKSSSSSSTSIRAYLYSRSKSFLSDIRPNNYSHGFRSSIHGDSIRKECGTLNNEKEERTEEGIEVGNGCYNALETASDRCTACTEAHHTEAIHTRGHPSSLQYNPENGPQILQSQPSHNPKIRKGNVQVQINGRYVPQLDMIFSAKRGNAMSNSFLLGTTTSASGGGSYGDDESTSCRFVIGNGLRPSTEVLNLLLMEQGGEHSSLDEQSCSCHEDIKRSEFHLCCTTTQQDKQRGAILTLGRNLIRYTLFSPTGAIVAIAEAHLYLWNASDSIIVSDIDGTITKSDIRGVFDTIIQDKFEHVHDDICDFFQSILDVGYTDGEENFNDEEEDDYSVKFGSICKQQSSSHLNSMNQNKVVGVRFLYLSARPISLIGQTRKFLQSVSQPCPKKKLNNLPPGPILCHRSALSLVLYSELVAKNIHEFKADVLARQVVLPFVAARGEEDCKPNLYLRKASDNDISDNVITDTVPNDVKPERSSSGRSSLMGRSLSGMSDSSPKWDNRLFLAGFGNKMSDAIAYEMAGIDRSDIYIIDTESQIFCVGANEGIPVDGRSHECISGPADLNSSRSSLDCCTDPVNCSFVEVVCCPGGVDGQIFSEMTAHVHSNHVTDDACIQHESNDVYTTTKADCGDTSTSSDRTRRRSSIKAFTSKIPMKKFPSFKLASSMAKKPSPKKLFDGYGDPLLLERIRRRVAELE